MQKVLAIGDTHGEWGKLCSILAICKPDIAIILGDFGWWPKLFKTPDQVLPKSILARTELHFLDGNHEDHAALLSATSRESRRFVEIAPRIFYHPRGSTWTLADGRTVFFAGGGKSIDWRSRTEGKDWYPEEILKRSDLPETLPEVDVVMSHTIPAVWGEKPSWWKKAVMLSYDTTEDPSRKVLDAVLFACKPKLWLSGHHHRKIDRTRHLDGFSCHHIGLDKVRQYFCGTKVDHPWLYWLSGHPEDVRGFALPDGSIVSIKTGIRITSTGVCLSDIQGEWYGRIVRILKNLKKPIEGDTIIPAIDFEEYLESIWWSSALEKQG